MSISYRAEMWRRLCIRIVLSRMGCFTNPHQNQLSTDSCVVLLALHAGSGGVGQWRIALLDPSYYLLKKAYTCTAELLGDVDRPGAGVTSYFLPLPSDGAAIATCTALESACCLLLARPRGRQDGEGPGRVADHGTVYRLAAGAPWTSRMRSSSSCAGSRPARCQPTGASSSASRARFAFTWPSAEMF
jgi:hypothetical protein